jgi:hypothetical protein
VGEVTGAGARSPGRRVGWPLVVIGWIIAAAALARGVVGDLDPLDAVALIGAGATFIVHPTLRGRWYWEGYTDGWVDAGDPTPVALERTISPSARAAATVAARLARPFTR